MGLMVFFIARSCNKDSEEAARLQQQHIQDSIAMAQAEAEKAASAIAAEEAERAAAEAEAARAAAEAAKYATATGTYSGRIAGSKFKLRITQTGGELSGQDNWRNNSTWLSVYGTINGSSVNLEEYDEYGSPNASMNGTISGKYFSGTFYNYNTGKSFSFTLTR